MKRVITIVLLLCLIFTLTACGGSKCIICGKKATTTYRYPGPGDGKVIVGNTVYVFYSTGDPDSLCDDCLKIVEAQLGKSK